MLVWLVVRGLLVHPSFYDIDVYRAEGLAVRHGTDLYAALGSTSGLATYPPFSAIVFVAVTLVPVAVGNIATVVANMALVAVVAWLSTRLIGLTGRARMRAALVLAAVSLWFEPVYTTMNYGQINLALLALVLWDFTAPASRRWRGIGVGLATALKVTPGIFVVYLLLTRRPRMALVALATFAGTLAVSAAVDPGATRRYWTQYLFDTKRVGPIAEAANQSVRGLLARITHTPAAGGWALAIVVVIFIAGLGIATLAHRRVGEAWGLPACAVTGLLCSPISWTHHWVWCVPIALLLWQRRRRWRIAIAVFLTYLLWLVPHNVGTPKLSAWQILDSVWYVAFGLAFLGLAATVARQARGTAAQRSRPRDNVPLST